MIDNKSFLGDLEIVHSEQIHTSFEKTVKLEFADMKIEIKFADESNSNSDIDWKVDSDTLSIIFKNYTSPLGSGILEPWYIGTHNNKKFYITIYLKSIEHGTKKFIILNYVYYLGEEVIDE